MPSHDSQRSTVTQKDAFDLQGLNSIPGQTVFDLQVLNSLLEFERWRKHCCQNMVSNLETLDIIIFIFSIFHRSHGLRPKRIHTKPTVAKLSQGQALLLVNHSTVETSLVLSH